MAGFVGCGRHHPRLARVRLLTVATYKDIQRLTGLSLSTISKHFNDLPVREDNRKAIEEAARTLGFRRNAFARALRTKKSRVIGVLLPELDNAFHMSIIAGVEAALRAQSVGILVRAAHGGLTDGIKTLRDQMVDGIIAVPAENVDPGAVREAIGDVPLVLVDRRLDGLSADSVTIDNEAAGARGAECLLAFGHRSAAALVGPSGVWTMQGRLRGFSAVFGGDVTPLTAPDLTVPSGYSAMAQALATRDRPTAVFCGNYELTLGALTAINNMGLNVPGDISLVGFDGWEFAQLARPRLWTLVQPIDQLASETAELMLARLMGDDSPPQDVVLDAQLMPGHSVASPGGAWSPQR